MGIFRLVKNIPEETNSKNENNKEEEEEEEEEEENRKGKRNRGREKEWVLYMVGSSGSGGKRRGDWSAGT